MLLTHEEEQRNAVVRYQEPLTTYAYKFLGNIEKAREVVQEAFLRMLDEDFEKIRPYLAQWLYTVCRNKAVDIRRKESRMSPISTDDLKIKDEKAFKGDDLEDKETFKVVLKHLELLPENQREVIRLKFQNGLSYAEIAEVTKLTSSNVGFLIHTGIKKLREEMKKEAGKNSTGQNPAGPGGQS